MNFDLKSDDMQLAQFNMIVEILAQTVACKELLIEIYAKQESIDYKEAFSKIEKKIDNFRKQIDEKLDADYGHIDIKDVT